MALGQIDETLEEYDLLCCYVMKAFVIMNDNSVSIRQMNLQDVCKDEELLENAYLNASIRKKKIKELNFAKIREQLESEILEKVNS